MVSSRTGLAASSSFARALVCAGLTLGGVTAPVAAQQTQPPRVVGISPETPAPAAGADAPTERVVQSAPQPLVYNVDAPVQRLEMIVNTSRILTLDQRVPQAQVNNPEILTLTPLSANQVQISARRPGVTQVNIWNEANQIYTVDVVVVGDARELAMHLQAVFPKSSLNVSPTANSVIISGYVDDPNQVARIVQIAQDYYPNVINNITVGGVQQVLLKVRVMEVSRTKLRRLGVDFLVTTPSGDFAGQGVSDLLRFAAIPVGQPFSSGAEQFAFGIVDPGNTQFFMFLDALRQDDLAKVLAEPNVVTVSGRPAFFNAGGEFPILVPQSLGTVSIEYRRFGTQVDFVPIVLGNGAIRLECRPRVSEIDDSRGVVINGTTVPGLRVREIDTAVELRAGQTLAIAGLVQTRQEAQRRGIPYIMDVPVLGAFFSRKESEENEIELLILVTPELVEGMECHEVPPGGPGLATTLPGDCDLYWKGKIEVPACDPGAMSPYCGPSAGMSGAACPPGGGLPSGGVPVRAGEIVPATPAGPSGTRSGAIEDAPAAGQASPPTGSPGLEPVGPSATSRRVRATPAAGPVSPNNRNAPGGNLGEETLGFIGPTGYDVLK